MLIKYLLFSVVDVINSKTVENQISGKRKATINKSSQAKKKQKQEMEGF